MANLTTSYQREDEERDPFEALDDLIADTPAPMVVPDAAPEAVADYAPRLAAAGAEHDALDAMRHQAGRDYVQAAATPTEPGAGDRIGQFLGDSGIGILATLLDAGVNKGRNIPQIMTQTAQVAGQAQKQRLADENQAMDFQLRAQNQRAQQARAEQTAGQDAAYKQALQKHWLRQEGAAADRLGLARDKFGLTEKKYALENNPNHPAVVEWKQRLYQSGVEPGSLDRATMAILRQDPSYREQVDLFFKQQGIPIAAQTAYATGRAGEAGRTAAELEFAPQTAEAAAQRSAAMERGKQAVKKPINAALVARTNPAVQWDNLDDLDTYLRDANASKSIDQGLKIAAGSQAIYQNMLQAAREMQALPLYRRTQLDPEAARILANWELHVEEFKGVIAGVTGSSNQELQRHVAALSPNIVFHPNAIERIEGFKHGLEGTAKRMLGPYGGTAHFVDLAGGDHGQPAPEAAPADAVRVRHKATGKVKTLDPKRAKIYLDNPAFERVP